MSRLDEIKARAEAATKGPWHWREDEPASLVHVTDQRMHPWNILKAPDWGPTLADAAFIAAAREDVPWLLDLVDSLTAERDALAESWNPSVEDDRRWPYPAAQTVAELVVDAVLDKVFQHATEGVRRHALDVARKAVSSDGSRRGWTSDVATARVLAERDALAAQVARVEALAEEWDGDDSCDNRTCVPHRSADALRDALAGSEADTSGQERCPTCAKTRDDLTPGPHAEGWGHCPESFHFRNISTEQETDRG